MASAASESPPSAGTAAVAGGGELGAEELLLFLEGADGPAQLDALPAAGGLVGVAAEHGRQGLIEVFRIALVRQDDAGTDLDAGAVGADPDAEGQLVADGGLADGGDVVDVVALLDVELDQLGLVSALGGVAAEQEQSIVAIAAVEDIGTLLAADRVVAGAAAQGVVAFVREDIVVALAPGDDVGALAGYDRVSAIGAEDVG